MSHNYYRLLAVIAIFWIGIAIAIYYIFIQGWRRYPLQSALRGVISGFLVLCLNLILPTVNLQMPFVITIRPNFAIGPAAVNFGPPPDWILFGSLVLTAILAAWLAYLNFKRA